MRVSLVSYTYNDHFFLAELLQQAESWGVPFAEILIVDDASQQPFFSPKLATGEVRVIRLEKNVGPGQSKRLGLAAASGDVVLSLDADIRPGVLWLRNALSHLLKPQVGLVGATILPALAGTYLSRALYRMNPPRRADAESTFLAGGIWLFSRPVWQASGGLDDYAASTHEDFWYSRKLVQAGYKLILADKYPVYEKRSLHRIDYCRRLARYLAAPTSAALARQGAEATCAQLRQAVDNAVACVEKIGELPILYIEFLRITYLLLTATGMLKDDSEPARSAGSDSLNPARVMAAAGYFLREYPQLHAFFVRDITQLENACCFDAEPACWEAFETLFAPLKKQGVLQKIEAKWLAAMQREDAEQHFDSHYLAGDTAHIQ